jgi:hypothetical protein
MHTSCALILTNYGLGLQFEEFFSQTHLVTLVSLETNCRIGTEEAGVSKDFFWVANSIIENVVFHAGACMVGL